MIKNILFIYLSLIFSIIADAAVEVAFFEGYLQDGSLIQFEEGGRFYHVALKVDGGWLQAHPYFGVMIEPNINKVGHHVVTLRNERIPDIREEQYKEYLGLKFTQDYDSWDDPNSTYCSKLLGKILEIEPLPFQNRKLESTLAKILGLKNKNSGLSPNDLFRILSEEREFNFQQWKCSALL
jgi:hypothetical protein